MHFLLIESNRVVAISVEKLFRAHGHQIYTTDSAEEGIDLARLYEYHLILFGLSHTDILGYEVLQSIRYANVHTPIIVISARADVGVKVKCLSLTDDYLVMPYHDEELIARVYAVVRRSSGYAQSTISVGQMTFDLAQRSLEVAGKRIRLGLREYQVFELLILRKGTMVTRDFILEHLYDGRDEPFSVRIVDTFVNRLRKKIAAVSVDAASYIETVWGMGYLMRDSSPSQRIEAAE